MTDDVVEITMQFEDLPVGPADIRKRCEAIGGHMAGLEDERDDQDVATDGGVAVDGESMAVPQLGDRVDRAFEPMLIDELANGLFEITTLDGEQYRTDPSLGACTCPDHEYRVAEMDGKGLCKHALAVVFREGPDVLEVDG